MMDQENSGVWVVLISNLDAIEIVQGYDVDKDIFPNGGIIVDRALRKRIRKKFQSKPAVWEELSMKRTAEILGGKRTGTQVRWFPSADQIPRKSHYGPPPGEAPSETYIEKAVRHAHAPRNPEHKELQRRAKEIRDGGGPDVNLRGNTKALQEYVDLNQPREVVLDKAATEPVPQA